MKIERLFGILVILLNKDMITAKELAQKFEVTTRTIYRDVDTLSASGIPIYANKGRGGGISLLDHYTIDKTLLNDKNNEDILMALNTLKSTGLSNLDNTIGRLSALIKERSSEEWVEIDYSYWGGDKKDMEVFEGIKQGILSRSRLDFVYYDTKGVKMQRSVYPLKLIYKSTSWYLSGFCVSRKAIRLFKLSRMKSLDICEETFNRSEYIKLLNEDQVDTGYQLKEDDVKTRLVLGFNSKVAFRLYEYFDEEDIVISEDNEYIISIPWRIDDWVYSWILSFGKDVRIISPDFAKEEIIKRIKAVLERYD